MKNKKRILLIIIAIVIVLCVLFCLLKVYKTEKEVIKDNVKFSQEYGSVSEDNVFCYKTIDEIINILEHGTGVVYLGFPECPWCKEYVIYLNEVAKNSGCDKVYYFNILNDRKDNTKKYQEIVNILKDYLPYDEEGNKRIYVPAVIAVKDGKIISFDDETSKDTKGYDTPQEYWKNEK